MKISPYIIAFVAVAALAWVVYSRREVRGGIAKSLGAGPLAKLPPPPSTTAVAPLGGKAPIPGRSNAKVAARIEAEKKAGAATAPTKKAEKSTLESIGYALDPTRNDTFVRAGLNAAGLALGVPGAGDAIAGTVKQVSATAKSIEKSLGIDIPFI